MSDFYASQAMPGPGQVSITDERYCLFGGVTWYYLKSIVLNGAACSDPFGTPTTLLRHGLLLGMRYSDNYFANYVPSAVDGTGLCAGMLFEQRVTYDSDGNVGINRPAQLVMNGPVKAAQIYAVNLTNFDEQARRQLQGKFIFDDRMVGVIGGFRQTLAKGALGAYTVVNGGQAPNSGDNDTIFTTTGGLGATTFTLGTPARGNRFRFYNTVNQTMTITAPANTLLGASVPNTAAKTNLAFAALAGAAVEITCDDTGAFWMAWLLTPNTGTFS